MMPLKALLTSIAALLMTAPALADEYRISGDRTVETLEQFQECDICPEMIVLPMGSFTMGAPPEQSELLTMIREALGDDHPGAKHEGPMHKMEIDLPIAMARNEVTHDEWMACYNAGGCAHAADPTILIDGPNFKADGAHPVVDVSFLDIQQYVAWLNAAMGRDVYRLPTEAEWEYAARAGTTTIFPWGDELPADRAKVYAGSGSSDASLRPVQVHELDAANPWGLRHIVGNVGEQVLSCYYESHLGLSKSSTYLADAMRLTSCRRVSKGGDYSFADDIARPANRGKSTETHRNRAFGFRLVRQLENASP